MINVDWLTIHQRHPSKDGNPPLPIVGESLVLHTDVLTGERKKELVYGFQHEGSYDSSLRVRCDGWVVEVSGNPSRFGRLDNLFGLQTVGAAVDVFNAVLDDLSLPGFCEDEGANRRTLQRTGELVNLGAVITRVDLCRNLGTGSQDNAARVLRYLSGQSRQGKHGHLYSDGATCDWNRGSRFNYLKYYNKGVEMGRTFKKAWESYDRRAHTLDEKQRLEYETNREYQKRLLEWVTKNGVIRQELSLKAMMLKRLGLSRIGAWDIEKMNRIIDDYSVHGRTEHKSDYETIAETLIQAGEAASNAERAQQLALSWLAGYDLRPKEKGGHLSKTTFYRYRKILLTVGLDIATPCDVSRIRHQVKTINLTELTAPEWYRRAA